MSENCSLIFVSPDSLYKEDDKEDGDILGEIWLEVDGFAFPEKHWHDSVIILGEGLETLFKV
ncbi:MAG: hypothetical protein M3362_14485, partial [Acidobacteriota bacterium]|nr:hypothetical protein [Acidobacteriota bacterium]